MDIVSNTALITINETLIVQVVGFLVFLFVINRIMFRPLRNAMADRDMHIERVKRDITQAQNDLASFRGQIRAQEAAARQEALAIKNDLEAAGGQQAKEIFKSVNEQIAAESKQIQIEIETRIAEERKAVQKESQDLASGIVAKILDRRQSP